MKLAKSYENATVLETYEKDGKQYARIQQVCDRCNGSGVFYVAVHNGQGVPAQPDGGVCYKCSGDGKIENEARVYTNEEFERMEASKLKRAEKTTKKYECEAQERLDKRNLSMLQRYGFENLYGYTVLGNSFEIKDKLKEVGARYSDELRWVCPEEPTWLTTHEWVKLSVADVFRVDDSGAFVLLDDVRDMRDALEPTTGEYIGQIGEHITVKVTLTKAIQYDTYFGYRHCCGYIYIFKTVDDNTLMWKTASVVLREGIVCSVVGTVKDHQVYRHVKQTVLTRCKVTLIKGGE